MNIKNHFLLRIIPYLTDTLIFAPNRNANEKLQSNNPSSDAVFIHQLLQ